jgi:hypothetical protein
LLLLYIFPYNILAAAVYCLISISMLMLLTPLVAYCFSLATRRLYPLIALIAIQLLGSLGSVVAMTVLLDMSTLPDHPLEFWATWPSLLIYLGAAFVGGLLPICARLLDNAVDQEWVSLLYSRTERMMILGRIDICVGLARVTAPLCTGFLLSRFIDLWLGFYIVVGLALGPLLGAFACLLRVVSAAPGYTFRAQLFWRKRFPNPFTFLISEWPVYSNQTVFKVMITNLLLWISIFNPHSSIMIAILKCYDFFNKLSLLGNPVLGGFRSLGALLGWLLAPLLFARAIPRFGLITATQIFVIGSAVAALFSAIVFQFATQSFEVLTILFLCFLVAQEFFTCGFSCGQDQIIQAGVPKQWRNTLHVAQICLTDIALFVVFCIATICAAPVTFPYLIWTTFATITMAAILFGVWSLNSINRNIVLLGPMLLNSPNDDQDSLVYEPRY